MGYISDFEIELEPKPDHDTLDLLLADFEKTSGYWFEGFRGRITLYGAKWYDSDSHLKEITKRFPDYIFIVTRDGEESGDLTRVAYENGNLIREYKLVWEPIN